MIDLLQEKVSELTGKLDALRARKDQFLKAQGFEEEIARAQVEVQRLIPEIEAGDFAAAELSAQIADVVGGVCSKISETMSRFLPYGKAVFKIDGESIFVGWDIEGRGVIPYAGLSGGQAVAFKPALGYALSGSGSKIVVIEGAEMDGYTVLKLLPHLSASLPDNTQVIINTHIHMPSDKIPDDWRVTIL